MREQLRQLITDEIKEIELNSKSECCDELFSLVNKLIKLSKKKDKKCLCEMTNYEMLLIALGCSNLDTFTWEEIKRDALEIKDIVNNWTHANTTKQFEKLYIKGVGDLEVPPVADLEAFSSLGLTPNFAGYRMNTIYTVMERFLDFKNQIANAAAYVPSKTTVRIKQLNAPLSNPQQFTNPFNFPLANPNAFQMTNAKKTLTKQEIHEEIYIETQMKGVINAYEKYYEQEQKERVEKSNKNNRKIKIYEQILRMIQDGKINDLTDIPTEWDEVLNASILCELYLVLHDNILLQYQVEEDMKKGLQKIINKSPLTSYLYSKGIDPSTIDEDILKEMEKQELEKIITILDFLLKIGFNIIDIFSKNINLLTEINVKNLTLLNFLVDSHILTKTIIINNPCILTSEFKKIQTNYNILKPIIEFDNNNYDDSVLLTDTKKLKDIISVLKEYNLTKNNYMYLLCNYKMLNIYDLMIENEIPVNLFISICRTSNPLNTIKRIIIYKLLDISFQVNKYSLKKDVTSETKFICADEDLDLRISSVVPYMVSEPIEGTKITDIVQSDLAQKLETYSNSSDSYIFGTTIISKPKVLRNLEASQIDKEEDLLRAIISSSILSEKNVYEIQYSLQQKKLLK